MAALLLSASTSYAQPNAPAELAAVELKQGARAPFTGQLLTPELAAELAVGVEHCLDTKALELQHAERACRLRLSGVSGPLEVEVRALEGKLRVTDAALQEALRQREIPFWEEPMFVGTVAFAAGVIVAAGAVYASVWAVGVLRPAIPPVTAGT